MRRLHARRGLDETSWPEAIALDESSAEPAALRDPARPKRARSASGLLDDSRIDARREAPGLDDPHPTDAADACQASGAVGARDVHARRLGCADCVHRTVYGNCAVPVDAGLADDFMLIAHPRGGIDCASRVPDYPNDVAYLRVCREGAAATDIAVCPASSMADRLLGDAERRVRPIDADDAWR